MLEFITVVAICLKIADGWTTFVILNNGGKEVNKVMLYLIDKIGLNFTLITTNGFAILAIILLYITKAEYLLYALTLFYVWVVFHNIREIK